MNITIYSICWNEEILLPHFFKYYNKRFENAIFIIYDNFSSDSSRDIMAKNNATIIDYDSNNEIRDDLYIKIKNNCWKSATTDWVIVCDIDEFIDVDEKYLQNTKATIIKSEGYEMVGEYHISDNTLKGTRNNYLDKSLVFNKKYIQEINYSAGCHDCKPIGKIHFNSKRIILRHMKYINANLILSRFKNFAKRLSEFNQKKGYGTYYLRNESEILDTFNFLKTNSLNVPLPFILHKIESLLGYSRRLDVILLKILPKGIR
jgi:hypothetical protein